MVWRRRRRVGNTTQLIRFISFILILASVKSKNHTLMACADVMSTSVADKLSLHLYCCCVYDSARDFLISPHSLQGPAWCFLRNQTNPRMVIAVFILLDCVESLYYITNGVTRSCAFLSKNIFLFPSQAGLCSFCVHI
jgi:hypothetical protein